LITILWCCKAAAPRLSQKTDGQAAPPASKVPSRVAHNIGKAGAVALAAVWTAWRS